MNIQKIERVKRMVLNERGQCHSENGPACIFYDGDGKVLSEHYYLFDKEITKEEFERYKLIKSLAGVK